MEIRIPVNLDAVPQEGRPAFSGTFQRVNTIIGANGTGKSKLLHHFAANAEAIFNGYTPVLIEGGRAIQIPIGIGIDNQNFNFYSRPKTAREQYKQTRRSTLAARITRTFVTLKIAEDEAKNQHSDAVQKWIAEGKQGDTPVRATPPLTKLTELFSDVFPSMVLFVNENEQLFIRKGEFTYPVSSMSEGEKQVFTLLADIAILTNERSVFLIDEPELNLHPGLAEVFWASIEATYEKDIFIYATHNLSYALRGDVDAIFAIGYGQIDTQAFLGGSVDLRPFLGAIPGVVRSQRCLFVEGGEASFDVSFYRWLLDRRDIEVLPIGSSTDVTAAAARQGVWSKIASTIRVAGITDRDFKPEIAGSLPGVISLALHEAESYLCLPAIILAIRQSLSNSSREVTEETIINKIVASAQTRLPYVIAQRVFARSYINLKVSIERSGMGQVSDFDALQPLIVQAAREEAGKAANVYNEARFAGIIEEERLLCTQAISDRNPITLLKIFEGKNLLNSLCKEAGCETPLGMLKAVQKHISIDAFPEFISLRNQLYAIIG